MKDPNLLKMRRRNECFQRAIELVIQNIDDESVIGEVAELYPTYDSLIGKTVKNGTKFRHGLNSFGDPQIYVVIGAEHTVSAIYPPSTITLYKMIGVTAAGIPIWTQPHNQADAYDKGDEVEFVGWIWESTFDGKNVWGPPGSTGIDERWWKKVRKA